MKLLLLHCHLVMVLVSCQMSNYNYIDETEGVVFKYLEFSNLKLFFDQIHLLYMIIKLLFNCWNFIFIFILILVFIFYRKINLTIKYKGWKKLNVIIKVCHNENNSKHQQHITF